MDLSDEEREAWFREYAANYGRGIPEAHRTRLRAFYTQMEPMLLDYLKTWVLMLTESIQPVPDEVYDRELKEELWWWFLPTLNLVRQQLVKDGKLLANYENWELMYRLPPKQLPSLTPDERFNVLKRDDYRCRICGRAARDGDDVRLEVDHIIPRARRGTNDKDNLWTLCMQCNRGKGIKDL